MGKINTFKFKGLKNGKDWEIGSYRVFDDDLAIICTENSQYHVFKESISRFTGFVNASGEEIYEGDLLAPRNPTQSKAGVRVVFWDQDSQQWKAGSSLAQDPLKSQLLEDCLHQEIVGHLFTHEYLLTAQKRLLSELQRLAADFGLIEKKCKIPVKTDKQIVRSSVLLRSY